MWIAGPMVVRICHWLVLSPIVGVRTGDRRRIDLLQRLRRASQGSEHDRHIFYHHADIGMLRIAGFAGQLIVAELVYIAAFPFARDLFEDGVGKTSEPKTAGTFSLRICSISRITSLGLGSAKSDGCTAPITWKP